MGGAITTVDDESTSFLHPAYDAADAKHERSRVGAIGEDLSRYRRACDLQALVTFGRIATFGTPSMRYADRVVFSSCRSSAEMRWSVG
jgi:hypothetical protein